LFRRSKRAARDLDELVTFGVQARHTYESCGDPRFLDVSIDALERARRAGPANLDTLTELLAGLGLSLRLRYERWSDNGDLERAVEAGEAAVAASPSSSVHRPGYLSNLAGTLRRRHQAGGPHSDIDRAVALFDEATRLMPSDAAFYPSLLNNYGNALIARYHADGREADLASAVRRQREAVRLERKDRSTFADWENNLADSLRLLWDRTADDEALSDALRFAEDAVRRTAPGDPELPSRLSTLSTVLQRDFLRDGRRETIDRAVTVAQRAFALAPDGSQSWRRCAFNLAGTLLSVSQVYETDEPLDETIGLLQVIVGMDEQTGDSGRLTSCYSLAWALRRRDGESDLDRAIALLQRAADRSAQSTAAVRADVLALLADLQLQREQRAPQPNLVAVTDVVHNTQDALATMPPTSVHWPSAMLTLADAHAAVYNMTHAPADLDAARSVLTAVETATRGRSLQPDTQSRLAQSLGRILAEAGDWQSAVEYYRAALDARQHDFRIQPRRGQRLGAIMRSHGLVGEAAYAMVLAGDPAAALLAIERGQAMMLGEALGTRRAALDELRRCGHADLADAFDRAAARLRLASVDEYVAEQAIDDIDFLNAARAELDGVVARIQSREGWERFLRAPEIDEVLGWSADAPLVYVLAERLGGLALICRDRAVDTIRLPDFTDIDLEPHLTRYVIAMHDGDGLEDALDPLCAWLWSAVMKSVVERLDGERHVRIVPTGALALVPLHLAWTDAQAGREYVIDHFAVSYAPAAVTFAPVAGSSRDVDVLTVIDPQPVSAPALTAAMLEDEAIRSHFPDARRLVAEEATDDAVLAMLPTCDVAHLACHARTDMTDVLRSALTLADDRTVDLGRLLSCDLSKLRLAVLSGCETAVPALRAIDEAVGFPTGLLEAGADGVVGSLWKVDDVSTALLMSRFYEQWPHATASPAEALASAQRWLASVTNAELAGRFPGDRRFAAPASLSPSARRFWGQARAHSSPVAWGAFMHLGI
jgi:tetratricopeptide (TPR) repeat protein